MEILINLVYLKSTRGTHVYGNDDISGFYIPKHLFNGATPPERLMVVLTDPSKVEAE